MLISFQQCNDAPDLPAPFLAKLFYTGFYVLVVHGLGLLAGSGGGNIVQDVRFQIGRGIQVLGVHHFRDSLQG